MTTATARHAAAWAVGAAFAVVHALLWLPHVRGDDFAAVIVGARVLRDGHRAELYAADPSDFAFLAQSAAWARAQEALGAADVHPHPYVYNPLFAAVTAPLTGTSDFGWFVAWNTALASAAAVVLLWGSARLARDATGVDLWRPDVAAVGLLLLSVSGPMRLGMWLGQNAVIVAALCVAGVVLAHRAPPAAGAMIALASAVKMTPLLLVAVLALWPRSRAAAAWAAAWCAGAAAATFAVAGDLVRPWLDQLGQLGGGVVLSPFNQSAQATLARWALDPGAGGFGDMLFVVPPWVRGAAAALGWACLCGAAAAAALSPPRLRPALLTSFALLWPLLFSTLAWVHYEVMLLPALLLVAAVCARLPDGVRGPALLVPGLVVALTCTRWAPTLLSDGPSRAPELVSAGFWAAAILMACLLALPAVARRATFGPVPRPAAPRHAQRRPGTRSSGPQPAR